MSDLKNKRVVITRPRAQSEDMAALIRSQGAQAVFFPTIEIAPLDDPAQLDAALNDLGSCDWLIFTSANGVQAAWERMELLKIGSLPAGIKLAAVGPKTVQALEERSLQPDLVPAEYVGEAIAQGLGDLHGKRCLLLRADIGREVLPQMITAAGGIVHDVPAYRTLPTRLDPDGLAAIQSGVDILTFTSPSTLRNFAAVLAGQDLDIHHLPGSPLFACIGPVTAQQAQSMGLPVDILAEEYSVEGLVAAILKFYDDEKVEIS